MKKLQFAIVGAATLLSAPALAADLRMPMKAPMSAMVTSFNWSGCYVGVHGGGASGQKRVVDAVGVDFAAHDIDGWLAGGQIGCDWQMGGGFVFGVEGSASWADITGNSLDLVGSGLRAHSTVDFLGTFTGRIGWAFDQVLLYVKGGGAVANDRHRATCDTLLGACFLAGLAVGDTFASVDQSRWGWLIGGGIEWAFSPSWSAKVEYNYMDFGRERLDFAVVPGAGGGTQPFDIDQHIHVIKVGINYRFNWGGGAVAARY